MRPPKPTLYIRPTKQPYLRVELGKHGKPVVPADYEGQFYLRLSEHGRRVWRPYRALDAALIAQANIETNLERARKGIPLLVPLPEPDTTSPTIAAAVAEFIAYSESREEDWQHGGDSGLSPRSVGMYRKCAQDFADACADFGAIHMSEFKDPARGEAILLYFKTWLHDRENITRKKGKGAYTDRLKFTVANQFLARNGIKMKADRVFNPNDVGLVDHVDVPRVRKPTITEAVYYTPADLTAMLKAAEGIGKVRRYTFFADDLKDLVFVLLCTGMRDEEVQHLCWSDIQWTGGDSRMRITVQDKPQYNWRVKDHEKRIVSPDKAEILQKRLQARLAKRGERAERYASELLFPNSQGGPDGHFGLQIQLLQKRAKAAGYTFSRPEAHSHVLHNFRKAYATYQMLQGVPARNIQRDLGHSELATTERYLAIVDEPARMKTAYEAIK